jgi:S-methylmethionine-dependent homocysteine/selenocysteine methylase
MARYRSDLPQLNGDLFIADGGLETTLIFNEGIPLQHFAAFHVLQTPAGVAALREYYRRYASLACRLRVGIVLESATWRASADWASRLGYGRQDLAAVNELAVRLIAEIRSETDSQKPMVVSGCVGPRGDGYTPGAMMSERESEEYHHAQVETFAATAADMVCAMTINYAEEAIGIVKAAKHAGMPVAISFTVETDGRLPTGEALRDAILRTDAASSSYASYYMINCAHPTHFDHALEPGEPWMKRIRGIRANASRMSHAELNDSSHLDAGDPDELARQYVRLKECLPDVNVMGGCCGTDHRHVSQIATACVPLFQRPAAA